MNIENLMGQSEGTQIRDAFHAAGIDLPEFPAPGYEPPGVYAGQQVVDAFKAYDKAHPGCVDMKVITNNMSGTQIRDAFKCILKAGSTGGGTVPGVAAITPGGVVTFPPLSVGNGVTAGIPGSFTGTTPADMQALTELPSVRGVTPWAPGEYVLLGDGSKAYYDAEYYWSRGVAPPTYHYITGLVKNEDWEYVPEGGVIPATLAELRALGNLGQTTTWGNDGEIYFGPDSSAYWDGSQWQEVIDSE